MNEQEFKDRTKKIAIRIVNLVGALPQTKPCDVIGRQLLRSGTSIGANYRSACRAQSTADMVKKLKIVEEEADETLYWLELLIETGIVNASRLKPLMKEVDEVLSMIVASIKTLRKSQITNRKSQISNRKSQISNRKS